MPPSSSSPFSESSSDREVSAAPPAWHRLTTAARAARETTALGRDDAAPYGFSTRVVALWRQTREEERRLALWQRLSWRAAFASLTLCAVLAVTQRGSGPATGNPPLLEPPAITFPGL